MPKGQVVVVETAQLCKHRVVVLLYDLQIVKMKKGSSRITRSVKILLPTTWKFKDKSWHLFFWMRVEMDEDGWQHEKKCNREGHYTLTSASGCVQCPAESSVTTQNEW